MSAFALRSLIHLGGLVVAFLLYFLLPFSPVVNGILAGVFWISDSILAEFLFRRRATLAERQQDLRDRTDNLFS